MTTITYVNIFAHSTYIGVKMDESLVKRMARFTSLFDTSSINMMNKIPV